MGIYRFPSNSTRTQAGFTLLETLLVIIVLGILSSLTAPTYFSFLENYHLGVAQDKVHQGMRQAQSRAMQASSAWRFGIRENAGAIEWSVYQDGTIPAQWHVLSSTLSLDNETSLRKSSQGIYSVKFDYKGNAKILGRVTLMGKHHSSLKRCVVVSTLLGATRQGQQKSEPNDSGQYCY